MQRFRKEERLCSKKLIEELTENGRSFFVYPYKVIWLEKKIDTKYPAQVIITVPKKRFRKAYLRNKIKRLTREVYRKNKKDYLYKELDILNKNCILILVYVADKVLKYKELENKIIHVFGRLIKGIKN